MNVELRDLRWFLVLAEEEHFSRAAARCGTTQPTLTRSLARLETALGVRLVDRTTRSVALTGAGNRLRAEIGSLLPQVDSALRSVSSRRTLRLGFTWLLPSFLARHLITEFEEVTGARLELVRRDDRSAGVVSGHTDAAVLHGSPPSGSRLRVVQLGAEDRVAAVGAAHPLARRRRLRWADLAGHDLVVNRLSGTVGPALWPAGARPGVAVSCRTYDEWIEMVAADRGVGVLPASARDHPHPGVRYIALADAPPVPLVLVLPARAPHPLAEPLERIARAWTAPPSHRVPAGPRIR
ncbi:LysR family transcriptional regulator [Streptomyces sp. NPDC001781]